MEFSKALCVVLLLYSASFGESGTLENNSNSIKRVETKIKPTPKPKSPKIIAEEVEMLARQAGGTLHNLSRGRQFAYIYIQSFESDDVTFDNDAVKKALIVDRELPPAAQGTNVWPLSPDDTNFRMAVPVINDLDNTNYGHSEYQLFTNNGFGRMVTTFKINHASCPQYVILYSTLLPCKYPPNPPDSPGPRCAGMTLDARKTLKDICPGALFYLYTTKVQNEDYPDVFQQTLQEFKNKKILWINPNTPM